MNHEPLMNAARESDRCVVPTKDSNKGLAELAERLEGRRRIKENSEELGMDRTQSRATVSTGLDRVREVAKKDKAVQFTALMHHVD